MMDIPAITNLPESLRDNPQYMRYLDMWTRNETSITFVPLAEILREKGFLEEAREVCETGLKHNMESISGRVVLASIYSSMGRKEEAQSLAAQVLKRMPGHTEALKYVSKTDSSDASSDEIRELWMTPTMAEILAGQGEYGEAIRVLDLLLEKKPKSRKLKQRRKEFEEILLNEEKKA